jgi:hypothetical protein
MQKATASTAVEATDGGGTPTLHAPAATTAVPAAVARSQARGQNRCESDPTVATTPPPIAQNPVAAIAMTTQAGGSADVAWSDHSQTPKNKAPSIGTVLRYVTASRAAFAVPIFRNAKDTARTAPLVKNDIANTRTKIIVKLISSLGEVGKGLFKASHPAVPRNHMAKALP